MRVWYYIGSLALALQLAPAAWGDTLTLKNGTVVEGTYLGGTARMIRMAVGDGVQTFSVDTVAGVKFGGSDGGSASSRDDNGRPPLRRSSSGSDVDRPVLIQPGSDASSGGPTNTDPNRPVLRRADSSGTSSNDSDPNRPVLRRADSSSSSINNDPDRPVLRRADSSSSSSSSTNADPDRPVLRRSDSGSSTVADNSDRPVLMRPDGDVSSSSTAANSGSVRPAIQIPSGTQITVRMIDSVDSQTAHTGDTFRASIDEPVSVNDQVAIPRGAEVTAKLVEDQQSGKIAGKTVLKLVLTSVRVGDRNVDISTQDVIRESDSRGSRSAKVIGGATALGAILGGIAGGGRGAAIGAGSGAGVGTGAEEISKNQRVKVPSETRLIFTLSYSVQI